MLLGFFLLGFLAPSPIPEGDAFSAIWDDVFLNAMIGNGNNLRQNKGDL